jgi:amino acid transporter
MGRTDFLASLNLATFVIVFIVAALALFFFLRRRSDAHPLEGREERNVARDLDAGRPAPPRSPPREP